MKIKEVVKRRDRIIERLRISCCSTVSTKNVKITSFYFSVIQLSTSNHSFNICFLFYFMTSKIVLFGLDEIFRITITCIIMKLNWKKKRRKYILWIIVQIWGHLVKSSVEIHIQIELLALTDTLIWNHSLKLNHCSTANAMPRYNAALVD